MGEEQFDHAIKSNDFERFLLLFDDLSTDELWDVRNNENYQPLGYVKTKRYEITEEDRINIKNYLDDIGFSGVVSLSDAKGTYTITPTKQESSEDASFCMHSIAKVFTGTLALMTMSPDELKDKIQLSPVILKFLEKQKKEVYNHLKNPSLLQTMNHNGGFGDYLGEYEKAVVDGIEGETPPIINSPEDFLKYADTTTYPLDSGIYSNLGILLVGLAVQHKCKDKPYEELLKELILNPADIKISKSKPENGKFSASDPCKGKATGGPSGGYWTTSKELIKLGTWLQGKCNPPKKSEESEEDEKSEFLLKLEVYGKEFYDPEDEEIRHNGNSASGSSFLSSFLKSGVTIAVLSDQSNFMANRIYYTIREKMIEKSD